MMFSPRFFSYLLLYIDMMRDMIWPPCALFPVPGVVREGGEKGLGSISLPYRYSTYSGVERAMASCERC